MRDLITLAPQRAMQKISKTGRTIVTVSLLIMAALLSAVAVSYYQGENEINRGELETWKPGKEQHLVHINRPDLMPMVDSGKRDRDGNPVMIRCNNCHDTKKPNMLTSGCQSAEGLPPTHDLQAHLPQMCQLP